MKRRSSSLPRSNNHYVHTLVNPDVTLGANSKSNINPITHRTLIYATSTRTPQHILVSKKSASPPISSSSAAVVASSALMQNQQRPTNLPPPPHKRAAVSVRTMKPEKKATQV
jgi:hypothetical protein